VPRERFRYDEDSGSFVPVSCIPDKPTYAEQVAEEARKAKLEDEKLSTGQYL